MISTMYDTDQYIVQTSITYRMRKGAGAAAALIGADRRRDRSSTRTQQDRISQAWAGDGERGGAERSPEDAIIL